MREDSISDGAENTGQCTMWGLLQPNWVELLPRFVQLSSICTRAPQSTWGFLILPSPPHWYWCCLWRVCDQHECSVAAGVPSGVMQWRSSIWLSVNLDSHIFSYISSLNPIPSDFHWSDSTWFLHNLISFEFFWFLLSQILIPNDNPIANATLVENINVSQNFESPAPTNTKLRTLVEVTWSEVKTYKY